MIVLHAILVLVSFIALYGVLPWYLYRDRLPGDRIFRMAMASGIAVSLQVLVGTVWNALGLGRPWFEPGCWVASLFAVRYLLPGSEPVRVFHPRYAWLLGAILALTVLVRWIHPFQAAALGQSDAYSHLQFFHDVLSRGAIRNVVYPPGFHWMAMLPSMLLPIDPYVTARFGGGAGAMLMVLGCMVIMRRNGVKDGGWVAGAMIGFFPGAVLLQKTGVGMFPNQLGLAMLPLVLAAFLEWPRGINRRSVVVLLVLLAGIGLCVPIMTIDLVMVLAVEVLFLVFLSRRFKVWGIGLLLVPVVLLGLLYWKVERLGTAHLVATVSLLVGSDVPEQSARELLGVLFADFFSLKRSGLGSMGMNLVCAGLCGASLGLLFRGVAARNAFLRVLGIWGVLAAVQTGLGLFQFGAYQRAGWQLLQVGCVVAGTLFQVIAQRIRLVKALAVFVLLASALISVFHPPSHLLRFSAGEEEMVRWLLALKGRGEYGTLIARSFCGFPGGQGDPVLAVMEGQQTVKVHSILPEDPIPMPEGVMGTTWVIVDQLGDAANAAEGAFKHVNPEQAAYFEAAQKKLFSVNASLLDMVEDLQHLGLNISEERVSENLTVYRISE